MSTIWSRLINLAGNITGILPLANGGTNAAITATQGGLIYSTSSALAVNTAGTASDWALSGGTGTPTFSSTTTTAKLITGSADAVQLKVTGNATQTNDILDVFKSDGTTKLIGVTNTAGTLIKGTTLATAVATGFVGEIQESLQGSTNVGTSAQYFDATTVTLTAGDWDVDGMVHYIANGATISVSLFIVGIWTASGNDGTGLTLGQNGVEAAGSLAAGFTQNTFTVPQMRVSSDGTSLTVNGTTTTGQILRLKLYPGTYSVATPTYQARLTARRVR